MGSAKPVSDSDAAPSSLLSLPAPTRVARRFPNLYLAFDGMDPTLTRRTMSQT